MPAKFDRSLLPASPDLSFETELWSAGLSFIAGIDEAGRGALAGPVSAAAIILPAHLSAMDDFSGVRDSKEMSPDQRTYWAERLRRHSLGWGVGFASHTEIDALGIVPATCLAARRAVQALPVQPQHLLLDYLILPECTFPQTSIVKGDARSLSIAAASVLAKTARDAHLVELDARFPGYGFALHKGYATAAHRQALARFGPCPVHRRSFRPIRPEAGVEIDPEIPPEV